MPELEQIAEASVADVLHYVVDKVTHASEDHAGAWHARIDQLFADDAPAPAPAPTKAPASSST